MRWLRLYDDIINDPKVLKLPEAMRWHWVAMLCIASKNGGDLPALEDIAIQLRVTPAKATEIITVLVRAILLDKTETGFAPHNWNGRQYKTDTVDPTAASRAKRYRDRKRDDRDATVTDKRPETENRIQKETEAIASGAEAPRDVRAELFDRGLKTLARLTGKGPDACRSFVGKCLKAASDDAVTVLGLIEDADRNRVVDPSAWISVRLKSTGPPARPLTEHQRGKHELRGILDDLDRASGQGGERNPRLLSGNPSKRSQAVRVGSGGDVIDLPAGGYRSGG